MMKNGREIIIVVERKREIEIERKREIESGLKKGREKERERE